MGKPVKILDLAKDLIRLSGLEPDVDIKIEFTGLRPGDKLYEEPMTVQEKLNATKYERIYIVKPTTSDINRLRKEIKEYRFILGKYGNEVVNLIERLTHLQSMII